MIYTPVLRREGNDVKARWTACEEECGTHYVETSHDADLLRE